MSAQLPRFLINMINSTTEEQMRETCTVAHENSIPITIHLSESKADHDYFCSLDHSPSSYAESVGLLGPSTVLAHAVHVDKTLDIPKFTATGTHISHCPSSNSKLASGISPVPELLAAGVNVSLGCDGGACNSSLDIFQEMKWAAMLSGTQPPSPQRQHWKWLRSMEPKR